MRSRTEDSYEAPSSAYISQGTDISLEWLCVDYNFSFGNTYDVK